MLIKVLCFFHFPDAPKSYSETNITLIIFLLQMSWFKSVSLSDFLFFFTLLAPQNSDVESFQCKLTPLNSTTLEKLRHILDHRCIVGGGEQIFLLALGVSLQRHKKPNDMRVLNLCVSYGAVVMIDDWYQIAASIYSLLDCNETPGKYHQIQLLYV